MSGVAPLGPSSCAGSLTPPSPAGRSRRADLAPLALLLGRQPAAVAGARARRPARLERRHLGALLELVRAARAEVAALGPVGERRRQPRDRRQALRPRPVDARDRAEQAPRVGVLRVVEDLVERALLDDPPAYITAIRSAMSATTPRSWVTRIIAGVRSRRAARGCCSRICAWIVTSSAVVGSSAISTLGVARERHRDHHALAHAARELVRVGVERARAPAGCRRARAARSRARAPAASGSVLVRLDLLDDLVADLADRVQRGHRVLEDHRDLGAAHAPQLVLGGASISSVPL